MQRSMCYFENNRLYQSVIPFDFSVSSAWKGTVESSTKCEAMSSELLIKHLCWTKVTLQEKIGL